MLPKMVVTVSDVDQLILGHIAEQRYITTRNSLFEESPHLPEKISLLSVFADISSENRLQSILEEYVGIKTGLLKSTCKKCTERKDSVEHMWDNFDELVSQIKTYYNREEPQMSTPKGDLTTVPEIRAKSPSEINHTGKRSRRCFGMSSKVLSSSLRIVPLTMYEPLGMIEKKHIDPVSGKYVKYCRQNEENKTSCSQEKQTSTNDHIEGSKEKCTTNLNEEASRRKPKKVMPKRLTEIQRQNREWEQAEHAFDGDLSKLLNFPDNDALVVVGANIITNMKKCAELSQKAGLNVSPQKSQNIRSAVHVSPFKNPAVAEIDVNTLMTTEMRKGLVEMTLESLLNSDPDVTSGFMNEDLDDEFIELKKLLDSSEIGLSDLAEAVNPDDNMGKQENIAEVTSTVADSTMENVTWVHLSTPTGSKRTDCNDIDVSTSSEPYFSREPTVSVSQPNQLLISGHGAMGVSDVKDLGESIVDTELSVYCISSSSAPRSSSPKIAVTCDMSSNQSVSMTCLTDSLSLSSNHAMPPNDSGHSPHGSLCAASQCIIPSSQCDLVETISDNTVQSEDADIGNRRISHGLNDSSTEIACSLSKKNSTSSIVFESIAVESNETLLPRCTESSSVTVIRQEPKDTMEIPEITSCPNLKVLTVPSVETSEILACSPMTSRSDQHERQTLQTTALHPGINLLRQPAAESLNSAISKNNEVQTSDAISGSNSNICEQVVPYQSATDKVTVPLTFTMATMNYHGSNTFTHSATRYTTSPVSYYGCSVISSYNILASGSCTTTVSSSFQLPGISSLIPIRYGKKESSIQNSIQTYYHHNAEDENSTRPENSQEEVASASPIDTVSSSGQTYLEIETVDMSPFKNCSSMPPKKRFLAIEHDQVHSDWEYKINKLKNLERTQKTRSKSLDGAYHLIDGASLKRSSSTPAGISKVSKNIASSFPIVASSSLCLTPAQTSVVCDLDANTLSSARPGAEGSCSSSQYVDMCSVSNTHVCDTENVANNEEVGKIKLQQNKKKITGNTNENTPLRRSSRPRKPTQALLDSLSVRKPISHSARSLKKVTPEKATDSIKAKSTSDNKSCSNTDKCSPNKNQAVTSTLSSVTRGTTELSNDEQGKTIKKNIHVMRPGRGSVVINFGRKGRMPMHVQGILVQPNNTNEELSRDQIIGHLVTQMESKCATVSTRIPSPTKSQTVDNSITPIENDIPVTIVPPVCDLSSPETFHSTTRIQEDVDPSLETQRAVLNTPVLSSTVPNSISCATRQDPTLMPKSLLNHVSLTSTPPKYKYTDTFSTISPSAGIFSIMARSIDKKLDARKSIQLSAVAEHQINLASVKSNLFDSFLREEKISSVETGITKETQQIDTVPCDEHQVVPLSDVKVSESNSKDIALPESQNSVNTVTGTAAPSNENSVVSSIMPQCISNAGNEVPSAKSNKILFHRSKKPLGIGSRSVSRPKPRKLYLCNKLKNMSRIEPKKFSVPGVRRYYVPQALSNLITTVSPSSLPNDSIEENTNKTTEPVSYEESNKIGTLLNSGSADTSTKPNKKFISAKKRLSKRKRKRKRERVRRLKEGVQNHAEPKQTVVCSSLSDKHTHDDIKTEKSDECDDIERSKEEQVSNESKLESGVKNNMDEGLQSTSGLDDVANPEMQNNEKLRSNVELMWQTEHAVFQIKGLTHDPDVNSLNKTSALAKDKFYARDGFDMSKMDSESRISDENKGRPTTIFSLGTKKTFEHMTSANGSKEDIAGTSVSTVCAITTSNHTEVKSNHGDEKMITPAVTTDADLVSNLGEFHDKRVERSVVHAGKCKIETITSNSTCSNAQHTAAVISSSMDTGKVAAASIDAGETAVTENIEAKKQKRKRRMREGHSKRKKRRLEKLMKSPIMNWSYEEIQAKLNLIHGEKKGETTNTENREHHSNIVDVRSAPSVKIVITSPIAPKLHPDVFAQSQNSTFSEKHSKVNSNLLGTSVYTKHFSSPRKSRISCNPSSDERIFTVGSLDHNKLKNRDCLYEDEIRTSHLSLPTKVVIGKDSSQQTQVVHKSKHSLHSSASKYSERKQTDFEVPIQSFKKKQPRRVQLFPCDKTSEKFLPKSPFKPCCEAVTKYLGNRHSPTTIRMVADSLVELSNSCGSREKLYSSSKTGTSDVTTRIHENQARKEMEKFDPIEGCGLSGNEPLDLSCSSWSSDHLVSDPKASSHSIDSKRPYQRKSEHHNKGTLEQSKPERRLKCNQFPSPNQHHVSESRSKRKHCKRKKIEDGVSGNSSPRTMPNSSTMGDTNHGLNQNAPGIRKSSMENAQLPYRVKDRTPPSDTFDEQQGKQSFHRCSRLVIHESNREIFRKQLNENSNFRNKRLQDIGNKDSPSSKVDSPLKIIDNPQSAMSQLAEDESYTSQYSSVVKNNMKAPEPTSDGKVSKKKKHKKKKTVVDLTKIDISKFLSSLKYDSVLS